MPEIARFLGLVITIFFEDHNPPRNELFVAWRVAQRGETPEKIAPLKI